MFSPPIAPNTAAPAETFDRARRRLSAAFDAAQLPDSQTEARMLLMHASGLSRAALITENQTPVPASVLVQLDVLAARRIGGEPIDHILGWREFYGRRFTISKDVLSPRQETEEVLAKALSLITDIKAPKILDLGTGSGAIIITAACERGDARAVATDISPAALKIAQQNAEAHQASSQITFLCGNWLEPLDKDQKKNDMHRFDLIISNPPYIQSAVMAELSREVRDYDPSLALDGGEDGLNPYKIIARDAPPHMTPEGWITVEIGYDQGQSAADIFKAAGYRNVELGHDLAGLPRIISAQAPFPKGAHKTPK